MKFKTRELTGRALNVAVELALGATFQRGAPEGQALLDECKRGMWRRWPSGVWSCVRCCGVDDYCGDWTACGPIIDKERISTLYHTPTKLDPKGFWTGSNERLWMYGPTALVAAMRCFVASKLGDEVDIPKELLA